MPIKQTATSTPTPAALKTTSPSVAPKTTVSKTINPPPAVTDICDHKAAAAAKAEEDATLAAGSATFNTTINNLNTAINSGQISLAEWNADSHTALLVSNANQSQAVLTWKTEMVAADCFY